jgi:hypothetical protein
VELVLDAVIERVREPKIGWLSDDT